MVRATLVVGDDAEGLKSEFAVRFPATDAFDRDDQTVELDSKVRRAGFLFWVALFLAYIIR